MPLLAFFLPFWKDQDAREDHCSLETIVVGAIDVFYNIGFSCLHPFHRDRRGKIRLERADDGVIELGHFLSIGRCGFSFEVDLHSCSYFHSKMVKGGMNIYTGGHGVFVHFGQIHGRSGVLSSFGGAATLRVRELVSDLDTRW